MERLENTIAQAHENMQNAAKAFELAQQKADPSAAFNAVKAHNEALAALREAAASHETIAGGYTPPTSGDYYHQRFETGSIKQWETAGEAFKTAHAGKIVGGFVRPGEGSSNSSLDMVKRAREEALRQGTGRTNFVGKAHGNGVKEMFGQYEATGGSNHATMETLRSQIPDDNAGRALRAYFSSREQPITSSTLKTLRSSLLEGKEDRGALTAFAQASEANKTQILFLLDRLQGALFPR